MTILQTILLLTLSYANAFNFSGSKEDFTKQTFIGKTMKDVNAKYKSPYKTECDDKTKKLCVSKYSENCTCYEVPIYRERDRSQTVYIDFHKDTVVNQVESWGNLPSYAEFYMKPLKEFSGDTIPNEIYDDGSGNGWQTFRLKWVFDKVFVAAVAWCPLEKFGGKLQLKKKIRDCYLKTSSVSTIDSFPKLNGTKVNAEY